MKQIREYKLSTKKQSIIIPKDSEILNAALILDEYEGELYLYALVDPEKETEFRQFYVAYKDNEVHFKRWKFINSVVIGRSVAHIFEILEE